MKLQFPTPSTKSARTIVTTAASLLVLMSCQSFCPAAYADDVRSQPQASDIAVVRAEADNLKEQPVDLDVSGSMAESDLAKFADQVAALRARSTDQDGLNLCAALKAAIKTANDISDDYVIARTARASEADLNKIASRYTGAICDLRDAHAAYFVHVEPELVDARNALKQLMDDQYADDVTQAEVDEVRALDETLSSVVEPLSDARVTLDDTRQALIKIAIRILEAGGEVSNDVLDARLPEATRDALEAIAARQLADD